MIRKAEKKRVVGEIVDYIDHSDKWVLIMDDGLRHFDEGVGEYKTAFLESVDDLYIDEDIEKVFKYEEIIYCSECGNEPIYDRKEEKQYCPVCK